MIASQLTRVGSARKGIVCLAEKFKRRIKFDAELECYNVVIKSALNAGVKKKLNPAASAILSARKKIRVI